jgi:hypothetical protein
MQMVKIQIPDKRNCAKALTTLMVRCRVDCYRDNVFVVPEPALDVLTELAVAYQELGRGGLDYALKMRRDSLVRQGNSSR